MPTTEERVTSIPSPADPAQHIPRIATDGDDGGGPGGNNNLRPFRPDDMVRVLDFDNLPPPPPDCTMLHGEGGDLSLPTGGPSDDPPSFPERYVCLRGSFLFYFDVDDVDADGGGGGDEDTYQGPPTGVIPLDRCSVEFPPGGRRVFREHAGTVARNGYEILVRHRGDPTDGDDDEDGSDEDDEDEDVLSGFRKKGGGGGGGGMGGMMEGKNARAPQYLVAESLGQREAWAAAIRVRAEVGSSKPTRLRPGRGLGGGGAETPAQAQRKAAERRKAGMEQNQQGSVAALAAAARSSGPRLSSARGKLGASQNPFDDDSDGADEGTEGGGSAVPPPPPPTASSSSAQQQRKSKQQQPLPPPSSRGPPGSSSADVDASQLGVVGDEREDVNRALRQFGAPRFDESDWVQDFFRRHNEFDAPGMCRTLEKWQSSMRKGLRGAVLEQYEYFVEASKEMTTMGREVSALRNLVDVQRDTVQAMREIDFAAAFADPVADDYSYYSGDEDDEEEELMDDEMLDDDDAGSSVASDSTGLLSGKAAGGGDASSSARARRRGSSRKGAVDGGGADAASAGAGAGSGSGSGGPEDEQEETLIEIPPWLDDVTEEVSAFVKECRYTDATDLIVKARAEVNDILNQHDKLTEKKLGKKQLASMQRILHDLGGLAERIGNRLAEGLRRKNEALKQTSKRERADPLSVLAPLVSPVCLNDDAVALQLLVKLGRPQDAATAYAARRSLLLMESLHERPIASAGTSGTMDVVIYAAQLSQSFFSCLSNSVEGFLDLFLDEAMSGDKANASFDEMSSLNSAAGKNVPAGAIAAVVLWCDSELSKFAAAFGGTRVLGNLSLSPPALDASPRTEKRGGNDRESIAEQRKKLREAEEMGEYAAAAKIRQRLAEREQEEKEEKRRSGRTRAGDDRGPKSAVDNKEREAAIDVAAKCVDQAFQFASENLDSIGLPMTPRLAEYIRARLKGCESEIAAQLQGKWDHITFDWNDEGAIDSIEESHMRADD